MARLKYRYRLLPVGLIVQQKFDSQKKVGHLKIPVLFIHGTKDVLVPPEMSRRLYEKTSAPKRLTFIRGGGHNNSAAVGGEKYLRSIRQFEVFVSQKS
jgi:fermentation-respiration switch protein FrsA (DUF1100 family)